MKENHSHVTRNTLWAMSLMALLSGGCTLAQQAVKPPYYEQEIDTGQLQAYDLKGKYLWWFLSKGQVESVSVGPDNLVFVCATHYKYDARDESGARVYFKHTTLYALDRKTGKPIWEFGKEGHLLSAPVVAGNRVLVATADFTADNRKDLKPTPRLYALSAQTGKLLWEAPLDSMLFHESLFGQQLQREGFRNFISVAEDRVLVAPTTLESYDDGSGFGGHQIEKIHVFDLASGKKISDIDFHKLLQKGANTRIVLDAWVPGKELVLLLDWIFLNEIGFGKGHHPMVRVDVETGKAIWQHEAPPYSNRPNIFFVATGTLLIGYPSKKEFYVKGYEVNTGREIWDKRMPENAGFTRPPLLNLGGDEVLGLYQWVQNETTKEVKYTLMGLNPITGQKQMELQIVDWIGRHLLLANKEHLYLQDSGGNSNFKILCIDALSGRLLWEHTYESFGLEGDPPRHMGGNFYLVITGRSLPGSSLDCIDATTGEKRWSVETGGQILRAISENEIYVSPYNLPMY